MTGKDEFGEPTLTGKPGANRDPVAISELIAPALLGDEEASSIYPFAPVGGICLAYGCDGLPSWRRNCPEPTTGVIKGLLGVALYQQATDLHGGLSVTMSCTKEGCSAQVFLQPQGDQTTATYNNLPEDCPY